ncbi:hypothetical protein MVEN_02085200 [Mycena venus]|uniref:Uncharacterized protein n=1 Tax=Mycena venus TaxID=2733690 RepID=A0A8H7CI64_9AGAR|nr:hypothetical protein MVEN_02085200 [Mycena venus]
MSPANPQSQEVTRTAPVVPPERVVSPTPSAKKRFAALQRLKKLGGKFKKSKKADVILEDSVPAEAPVEVAEEDVEVEVEEDPAIGQLDFFACASGYAPPPVKTDPPPLDADGRPIPPSAAIHTKDKKLIVLLSDPDVMNGSPDDGRISVWEALNALDAPRYRKPTNTDDTPGQPDGAPGDDDLQIHGDVMLYCPLHPTEASKVQLAATKTIEVPLTHKDTLWQSRWNLLWSYTVGLIKPAAPRTKLVTKWVPSTTQISFQALWWGYRMYLPPPVMAHLSSGEAEAVKIATTITAVLTWFLAHVSPDVVPPPLLPAFLLLQKLGPYAGYIGTFVSWIWGTVTGADKGYGVVLTATWILPVALIPSAMKAPDPIEAAPSSSDTPAAPATPVAPSTPVAPPATAPPATK